MSHEIRYLDYHCSVSEKAILKDISSFAYDPEESSGYHGDLTFHKDPVYKNREEAEAAQVEAEKKAAADLALATAEAEAQKRLAEAIEAEGKAKAAAAQAQGLAEAEAIRAKAEAEAKGMMEKAAALKEYGDAAKQQMELDAIKVLYEQLPAIAEAIGKGYNGAQIHLIGNDSGQLAGNMMGNITQIIEGFKGATGVDPMSVISGMLGAKLADNQ